MKKQKISIVILTAFWMLCGVLYSIGGADDSLFWWTFDKLNDRIFEIGILIICSSCFVDVFFKYFCYASIAYIAMRGYSEVLFINSSELSKFNEVMFLISGIYAGMVILLTGLYFNVRRK